MTFFPLTHNNRIPCSINVNHWFLLHLLFVKKFKVILTKNSWNDKLSKYLTKCFSCTHPVSSCKWVEGKCWPSFSIWSKIIFAFWVKSFWNEFFRINPIFTIMLDLMNAYQERIILPYLVFLVHYVCVLCEYKASGQCSWSFHSQCFIVA